MPQIEYPSAPPEYDESRRSQVVAITEAKTYAVIWVDGEGRKSMCLVTVFGKDQEEPDPRKRGPGVFILADEEAMKTTLKLANKIVKAGVQRHLEQVSDTEADDVPGGLSMIEIDEPMSSPIDDSADANPLAGILPT